MNTLTLTEEQMTDNLHLALEEIFLQGMILNRRKIVQAHFHFHGHTSTADVQIMPLNTVYRTGFELPEPLADLDIRLYFYEFMDLTEMHEDYRERMAKLETFIRYLDHLITMNKPIEVEIKETAA
jgi:hypothetical protein